MGVLFVLAAGGIDVSFTAIAALMMYALTMLATNHAPDMRSWSSSSWRRAAARCSARPTVSWSTR